jgi:hypothetical protein
MSYTSASTGFSTNGLLKRSPLIITASSSSSVALSGLPVHTKVPNIERKEDFLECL